MKNNSGGSKMKGMGLFKKNKKGFTLIELMVVITIVGILLVILLGRVTKTMDRSREKTAHKNLKNIKLALDLSCQASDGGYNYPTTSAGFKAKLEERFEGEIPRAVLRIGSGVPASNECYVTGSVTDIPVGDKEGWVLITAGNERGNVYINTNAVDTNGDFYTTYLCW